MFPSKIFSPHHSFFSLTIVKATFLIIAMISALIVIIIIFNSDLQWDYSYQGFNYFIDVFRVPLATLAMLIPLLAVYAANHRSSQNTEIMRLTNRQNNFSNYYTHLKEFQVLCEVINGEFVDKRGTSKYIKIIDSKQLHHLYFPLAKLGDYRFSDLTNTQLNDYLHQYISILDEDSYQQIPNEKDYEPVVINKLLNLCPKFFVTIGKGAVMKGDGMINAAIYDAVEFFNMLARLAHFDESYQESDLLQSFIELKKTDRFAGGNHSIKAVTMNGQGIGFLSANHSVRDAYKKWDGQ